jgi:cyclase
MAGELALLADGVYAWLGEGDRHGATNAGVIVDDDGITVVDTLLAPSQWGPLGDAVDVLGARVPRCVLTSSHLEFVGGTTRFPIAGRYGSAQTSAHLDQPLNLDAARRLFPEHADELVELTTRTISHVVREAAWISATAIAVPLGGQQRENLVVQVPHANVCFAGAMASFGVTPLCFDGDPAAWADALDRLLELAVVIVPGTGPVGGVEEVRALQGYLRACVDASGDVARVASGPWDAWPERRFDPINVERAALVAGGREDEVPRSMLGLLGLV